ncbi:hypothetical protein B9N43_00820 [Denitratisoma sp. DHT3]|uniref:type IV pilus secretin family protein n=1 Tax=Denitratisoma sp. DHT3 TaxID=1981880 RepID=UPI001198BABF|nr:type IV pilus secretin family protein [Denitratisoma sp. DHT3]QDX79919.1 hypothetical protein B9N43_00820 [Denitratisoma sp. DHT3]
MKFNLLRRLWTAALLLLAGSAIAAESGAGNAIERVEYSQLAGQSLVKVTLRNPLPNVPSSFTVSNPSRIAFDFPDTVNASGVGRQETGSGNLRSINVVQAVLRTRLVLNLTRPARYEQRIEGRQLYISLPDESAAATVAAAVAPSSLRRGTDIPAAAGSAEPMISNLDFQAASTDLAIIKIDLTEPGALLDVKQRGASLVLTFLSANLPERLEKKLDVRDFGTPVATLVANRAGKGSQIVLTNRGEWDYNVRQVDTSVVLEVSRSKVDPHNLAAARQVQGKVVSFNFSQPVPVSQMIGLFQDITGFNFVIMPGVTGEIQSLKMDNTPVSVAIDVISRMYGLGFRRYGDVVIVGKADDLAKYDKDERERAAALESVERIEQESIRVRYRPAAEIVQALMGGSDSAQGGNAAQGGAVPPGTGNAPPPQIGGGGQAPAVSGATRSLISSRGAISYDGVTNTIFVEETKSQLERIRERVALLDRPVRQVMIEARIVSVKDDYSRTLGARLNFLRLNNNGAVNTEGGKNTLSALLPSTLKPAYGPGQQVHVSGGFDPDLGAKAGDLMFSLFNKNQTRLLNLEITASETDNALKGVASPKVLTQDGRLASIIAGQNICFQLSGGINGPTTSCIDAATKLEVTPRINPDGKISMKINVNKGEPAANAGGVVTTNKREIKTNVVVENGGTLMLGGVFEDATTNNEDKVPLLGDLPVVGHLFKQNLKQRNRSELLIFITPRIVTEELTLQ